MRVLTTVLTVAVLPLIVVAHDGHYARQAPSSSSSHSGSSSPITPGPSSSSTVSGLVTASTLSSTPSITISLLATNPTAIPLASIVSNQPSLPTQPLTTTETPGPGPSNIPGAPPLPDLSSFNVQNYPAWDIVPPTDSPEVDQWYQEMEDTGIVIPDIPPTNLGGCLNNTHVNANDSKVCWWYCGGCTTAVDVVQCPIRNQWGVTYDDGPAYYTPNLTDYLSQVDLRVTFFVVGTRVIQFPETLQLQYMNGHQIAVHTWSHHYMTTLTNRQIVAELGWGKKAIKDVIGLTPNYWRPPFGDIDNRVRAISVAMGLTPVIWTRNNATGLTFDTGDFNIVGGNVTAPQVIQNFENIVASASEINSGFIVLEHDLFEQTVELATGYILPDAMANNPPFNMTPVITCLNMPMSNAYIETNDNSSNPPVISGPDVTTTVVLPSSTGANSHSSADTRFSVGFSLMFIMTIITLLAGVYAVCL